MLGGMQGTNLTVSLLLEGMERQFGHKHVATATSEGSQVTTYAEIANRIRKLVGGLRNLGLQDGDRVATFGWNSQRHLELYVAVPAAGLVLHTINHRLYGAQIDYILQHADDRAVFVDASLLPIVWPHIREANRIAHVIVMPDAIGSPEVNGDPRVKHYETFLERSQPVGGDLFTGDEKTAAGLCYTSGTTGDPKGVLYDHRSIMLHALTSLAVDNLAITETDVVMPIVPMFHANAWGLPYAAVMVGADIAMPGNITSPEALAAQLEQSEVTIAAAVATVWRSVLPHLRNRSLPHIRRIMSGGGPLPLSLSTEYEAAVGTPLSSSWGMTEMSPVGAIARLSSGHVTLSAEDQRNVLILPGISPPLVRMRLTTSDGMQAPWDGETPGELEVAGPTVAGGYYNNDDHAAFTPDGWLRTGDIATIDPLGYLRIVDRAKDLVKSGGEWISSAELENEIMAHPLVQEAAVIGVPDERWEERPLACVVVRPNALIDSDDIKDFLLDRVAKWWIPEEIVFVADIPKTATGKFSKLALRQQFIRPRVNGPRS